MKEFRGGAATFRPFFFMAIALGIQRAILYRHVVFPPLCSKYPRGLPNLKCGKDVLGPTYRRFLLPQLTAFVATLVSELCGLVIDSLPVSAFHYPLQPRWGLACN
jgi:hypothetical protein